MFEGGLGGFEGGNAPHAGVRESAPEIFFCLGKMSHFCVFHMSIGGFSAHGFLPMVFYFRLRN
jgi:hypothetical protein